MEVKIVNGTEINEENEIEKLKGSKTSLKPTQTLNFIDQ